MGKVRRIDYFPDEFLAGVDGMSLEQVGCYWLICSKIYSRGSAIPDDDAENARIFRVDPRTWRRVKAALIAKRKLRLEAGHIVNGRCATELSKAHKRIEDARKNGSEGGRPPGTSAGSPPDDSPMVAPTIPESLANRSPIVANKSGEVLSEHSDLAKAAGFSGEKLTSNQQPPTTKEEEDSPPKPNGKAYTFTGRIIHLSEVDFARLQNRYRETIPDLRAQLEDEDAYYDRELTGQERERWLHRLSRKLNNHHQRILRERRQSGVGNLNESF